MHQFNDHLINDSFSVFLDFIRENSLELLLIDVIL